MSFLSPGMLVLLAVVPLGIVVYRRVDSQRRAAGGRTGCDGLRRQLAGDPPATRSASPRGASS